MEQGELGEHRHLIGLAIGCHKRAFLGVLRPKAGLPQALEVQGIHQDHPGEHAIDEVRGQQAVDHTCHITKQTRRKLRMGSPLEGKRQLSDKKLKGSLKRF